MNITNDQIDAIDSRYSLGHMAPQGKESVRAFARELLALANSPCPVDGNECGIPDHCARYGKCGSAAHGVSGTDGETN